MAGVVRKCLLQVPKIRMTLFACSPWTGRTWRCCPYHRAEYPCSHFFWSSLETAAAASTTTMATYCILHSLTHSTTTSKRWMVELGWGCGGRICGSSCCPCNVPGAQTLATQATAHAEAEAGAEALPLPAAASVTSPKTKGTWGEIIYLSQIEYIYLRGDEWLPLLPLVGKGGHAARGTSSPQDNGPRTVHRAVRSQSAASLLSLADRFL